MKNRFVYGYDEGVRYEIKDKLINPEYALLKFDCVKDVEILFSQTVIVSDECVEVIAAGNGKLEIAFPAFDFDGREKTDIQVEENKVAVGYKNHKCEF